MSNKILAVLFIFVLISGIIAVIYLLPKEEETSILSTIHAIPIDACVILETKNFLGFVEDFAEENEMIQKLRQEKQINSFFTKISLIDSLANNNKAIKTLLHDKPATASIHLRSDDELEILMLLPLKSSEESISFAEEVNKLFSENYIITTKKYSEAVISNAISKTSDNEVFAFTVYQNIFILSFYPMLVEESCRILKSETSLLNDTMFYKVSNTAGSDINLNIFVNFKQLPKAIASFTGNNYHSYIHNFSSFADWSALDLKYTESSIMLYGYTFAHNEVGNYVDIMLQQKATHLKTAEVAPSNTAAFYAMAIPVFADYLRDYKSYLSYTGHLNNYLQNILDINKLFETDIEKLFSDIAGGEMATVFVKETDNSIEPYFLFKINDEDEAVEAFKKIIATHAAQEGLNPEVYETEIMINDQKLTIYKMPILNLVRKVFGDLFATVVPDYFAVCNNYLVFAKTQIAVEKYITAVTNKQTLENSNKYSNFMENLSPESNFLFYSDLGNSIDFFANYLNTEAVINFRKNTTLLKAFDGAAVQLTADNDKIYTTIYAAFNNQNNLMLHTAWECKLDTISTMKPQIVKNHITNENEVFVQDINNTIYLISSNGTILWKKNLNEPILGDVKQVDYYGNKKLQIMFNTASQLYLIDRNGNNVEKYPILLPAKATSAVAVFDYDNDLTYRIFIACENQKVYLFDKNGDINSGWQMQATKGIVSNEVQFLRSGGRDFILFNDQFKPYILSRKGEARFMFEENLLISPLNSIQIFKQEEEDFLFFTSPEGLVYRQNLEGKIDNITFDTFSEEHQFKVADINGDKTPEFIFLDDNSLTVFDANTKKLFSYDFDGEVEKEILFFEVAPKDFKIGIFEKENQQIFLFNSDGSVVQKFPIAGNSTFSIINSLEVIGSYHVIVNQPNGFVFSVEIQ